MKAIINESYQMDGKYLNEIKQELTWFKVPKGESDRELVDAVCNGSLNGMTDIGGRWWLVSVRTELIKWED